MRFLSVCLSSFMLVVTLDLFAGERAGLCDPTAMVDNCTVAPDSVKYDWKLLALCRGAPIAPTATISFDMSNCTVLFDRLLGRGHTVELNGRDDFEEIPLDLEFPADGTYDYFVWGIGLDYRVKLAVEFPSSTKTKGGDGQVSSGRYCRTTDEFRLAYHGGRAETASCTDTYIEPEYTTISAWDTGGFLSDCRSPSEWTAYWLNSELKHETEFANSIAVIAFGQMAPMLISKNTQVLNFDWRWDQQVAIDIETSNDTDGWFLPFYGCPQLAITAESH